MLISLISVKFGAVLLGPAGVGRLRMLQAVLSFATSITTLGIPFSAVQAVAQASAEGRNADVSALLATVRRLGWILGLVGWAAIAALAWPTSRWAFGDGSESAALAVLGITLLFSSLSTALLAPFQGFRRIGDLANMSLISAAGSTASSIALFAAFGESGIVASLVLTGAISACVPLLFRKRLPTLPEANLGWGDIAMRARQLAGMGIAVTSAGVCASLTSMAVPGLITRELGLESTGYYMAAWGISGLFANFILSAMVMDFFPRLSGVVTDPRETTRLVNEQTEVGVLLALPGVIATVGFGPLAITILYSSEFRPAADVLLWLAIGVFGRITSYPLGYLILAHRDSVLFVVSEVLLAATHVCLAWIGLRLFNLEGAGTAFVCTYLGYNIAIAVVAGVRYRVTWRRQTVIVIVISIGMIFMAFLVQQAAPHPWKHALAFALSMLAAMVSLRGLMVRLGSNHRIYRLAIRIPGLGWRLGELAR
jgi:PST family polysaccharide transporter